MWARLWNPPAAAVPRGVLPAEVPVDAAKIDASVLMWLEGEDAAGLGLIARAADAGEQVSVLVGLTSRVQPEDEAHWRSYGLEPRVGTPAPGGWVDRTVLAALSDDPRVQYIEPAASVTPSSR
jgi:hypothetical protein